MRSSNRSVLVLGGLSLVTALAHGAVINEHLRESAPFGIFFAVVAVAEVAWAAAVVHRPGLRTYGVGVLLNLGLVTLWVVSRTVGLPIGPEAGMAEPVGRFDLLCTIAEVGVVVVALAASEFDSSSQPSTRFHRSRFGGAV